MNSNEITIPVMGYFTSNIWHFVSLTYHLKIHRYSISYIQEAITECFHLKCSCYFKEKRQTLFSVEVKRYQII